MKKAERDKARPATKLEQTIMAADKEADHDPAKFGAELHSRASAWCAPPPPT